jgi:transposase
MPIKHGDRYQLSFLPPSIEEYVAEDDAVRAYDTFVDLLDWDKLQLMVPANNMGRPKYDPKTMLKLLLYSYSYGIRSSRKIERACYHNLSFIWLIGGLKPDHKTIAEFRRNNKKSLNNVFKQCVRFCLKCNLIEGNVLFIDGTKIRANASIKNTYTKDKCSKILSKVDNRIDELLKECEAIDQRESDQGSHGKLEKELSNKQALRNKVQNVMEELENENIKSKNLTDPDCSNMRSAQGTHASHNVQQAVDDKNGLIVHVDTTSDSNDSQQFANQVEQANEAVDNKCVVACGDAGYANTDELKKVDEKQIKVVVPSQKQALHNEPKPFNRDEFDYDSKNDQYTCPQGNKLTYRGRNKKKKTKVYRITNPNLCRQCQHFGVCTRSNNGRKLARLLNESYKQKFEKQYLEPQSQQIYKRRKEKVEHPFGHIKRNLKVDAFLMRGRDGTLAEMSLLATCFNITRMISILGMTGVMAQKAI